MLSNGFVRELRFYIKILGVEVEGRKLILIRCYSGFGYGYEAEKFDGFQILGFKRIFVERKIVKEYDQNFKFLIIFKGKKLFFWNFKDIVIELELRSSLVIVRFMQVVLFRSYVCQVKLQIFSRFFCCFFVCIQLICFYSFFI